MAISIAQLETLAAPAVTAQRGEAIYANQLRALLEPDGNGQIVAIHLATQEYFLGNTPYWKRLIVCGKNILTPNAANRMPAL